jgi:hypothetical protein
MRAGHPQNGLTAFSGMAHPQGGQPAAVFHPLGYPTPYGLDSPPSSGCKANPAKSSLCPFFSVIVLEMEEGFRRNRKMMVAALRINESMADDKTARE